MTIHYFPQGETIARFLRPVYMTSRKGIPMASNSNPVGWFPVEREHIDGDVHFPCTEQYQDPEYPCLGHKDEGQQVPTAVQLTHRTAYVHALVDGEVRIYGIGYNLFKMLQQREERAMGLDLPSVFNQEFKVIVSHSLEHPTYALVDLERTRYLDDTDEEIPESERPSISDALMEAYQARKESVDA